MKFEKPLGFLYAPVQFCGLELETKAGGIEYPMSLACSPTKPYLEFGARISTSAWKSAFASLEQDDEAEVDGAYGHFVLDTTAPAVLVAGGIGITPLKGMAEFAADSRLPMEVRLLYSSRTEAEIAYRSELDELARQNRHFEVLYTVTREPKGSNWKGRRGRITDETLTAVSRELVEPAFYVCGTPQMVRETYQILYGLGVPADRIKYEAFRGYEQGMASVEP